jgi:hypothetical protein
MPFKPASILGTTPQWSSSYAGFDEMDEATGNGSAEVVDDRSIEITVVYHNGDEAILKSKRDPSSTAC